MNTVRSSASQRGVSIVELMVVIAIVAILASIALPTYESHIQSGRRAEAREALTDFAARQEQFFHNNKNYSNVATSLGRSAITSNGYYVITFPSVTATTFTIRATAQTPQNKDTDCATMDLTWNGTKTPVKCW